MAPWQLCCFTGFEFLYIYQVLTPEQQLQARAVLYGQCVGDALGLLTEFLTKKEAKQVSASCVMKQESNAIKE